MGSVRISSKQDKITVKSKNPRFEVKFGQGEFVKEVPEEWAEKICRNPDFKIVKKPKLFRKDEVKKEKEKEKKEEDE